jgi:hypothetical protein
MATATTVNTKDRPNYRVQELLLVLVAAALVGFTIWYVRHVATDANQTYSIHETNQKAVTPKKVPTATPSSTP